MDNGFLSIAIVEDEKSIQDLLIEYINYFFKNSKYTINLSIYSDGKDLISNIEKKFDMILMDIKMKTIDGMTAAEKIRNVDDEVIIIFITNLAHMALKGYTVCAFDFILKPINYLCFSQSFQKALARLKKNQKVFLTININSSIIRLDVSKIIYIESFGHQIIIHTENKQYITNITMKKLEDFLINYSFFRCHNCFLVNLFYIESINNYEITVSEHTILISRHKKKQLIQALTNYMGGVFK